MGDFDPIFPRFSAIHFRGKLIRSVSCYLASSDFHGHRPIVIINSHSLWYLNERVFWHFNFTFGSARITSSAYQKWSTKKKSNYVEERFL